MPLIRTTPYQGYMRFDGMFIGSKQLTGKETPHAGSSTSTWANDGGLTWTAKGGDVCSETTGGGYTFSGKNGKSHDGITHIGTEAGSYPSTQIDGFQFKAAQDSGAGHGLFIRRWGFTLINASSTIYFYDCGGVCSRGSYGTKTYTHKFNATCLSKLQSGYVFDELRIGISTDGGTGTRTTNVQIYDFKYSWAGIQNKNLIIPAVRPFKERGRMAIA